MTCSEIENRLPAYMEDILSPEEKKSMEEHLASCSRCSQALADLKKADEFVHGLEEVEPPPFFEQRIMSRVREEAGRKKGILQRLFYPLYIKVPVQVMATFLVAVLAFYVYQKGEPEMKQTAPFPIPITENGKGRVTSESSGAISVPLAVAPAKRTPAGDLADKKQQLPAAPRFKGDGEEKSITDSRAPMRGERPEAVKSFAPAMTARERDMPPVKAEAFSAARDRAGMQGADIASETLLTQQKRKEKTAAKRSTFDLTIQVGDTYAAVREIEERLGQFNARIIDRQRRDGEEILKIEIAGRNIAEFLDRLKAIGKIDAGRIPPAVPEGDVAVSIKIKEY